MVQDHDVLIRSAKMPEVSESTVADKCQCFTLLQHGLKTAVTRGSPQRWAL